MEIKVKEVSGIETKSVQEVENELLEKHNKGADSNVDDSSDKSDVVGGEKPEIDSAEPPLAEKKDSELSEDDVLSFIKNKYGREVNSIEELTSAKKESADLELPEDVKAYYKYKKETGRSIEDFVKLNRKLDSENPDKLLREYFLATEEGIDEEDVDFLMEDFNYDKDLDDDSEVKRKKLEKKKAIAKAKSYFESEKEKYRIPLESSGSSISDEDKKQLEEYRQYMQQATTYEEEAKRKQEWFSKKTEEVFGGDFKGFEFTVEEGKNLVFSPGDSTELKNVHSNPGKFMSRFLDDKGLLKDPNGYHKSLAVAMNPEKFAKFFYEQGKSAGTDDVIKKTKNIQMSERTAPEVTKKGGTQFRAVNPDNGKGLKIKSRK